VSEEEKSEKHAPAPLPAKVWIVWESNGEEWPEDYEEWIVSVHLSEGAAAEVARTGLRWTEERALLP